MAYTDYMNRANDIGALIPMEYEEKIFNTIAEGSAVMRLATRMRDMRRQEETLRVIDGLPEAFFVGATTAASGDNARIQLSKASWKNKVIRAAKLGVIVPVPKDVIADQDYDLWGQVLPLLTMAFGKKFDEAVIYGTSAPTDWPDDLVTQVTAASHLKLLSSYTDVYDAVSGETGLVALIEEDGFLPNGHIGAMTMRGKLRGARTADGAPLFQSDPSSKGSYFLDGEDILFPRNGAINPAVTKLITGDWTQLVYSMRKGIEVEMLKEASIHNDSGDLVMNFAQDDMIGLKATMRLGWELPNPLNPLNTNDTTRCPFAILY